MPNDKTELMMELAKRQMQKEMPAELAAAKVVPFNWLDKILADQQTIMHTSLGNKIAYNPAQLQNMSQDEVNDAFAHELTHVKQQAQQPLWRRLLDRVMDPVGELLTPYEQQPWEMEAFQAERDRAAREHRTPPLTPSFVDGYAKHDIEIFPAQARK